MGDIDDEIKLKRYLYFLTENQHYIVPKTENIFNNKIDCLLNLLAAGKITKIIEIIEEANKFEWLPNRCNFLHVLTLCAKTSDSVEVKTLSYTCATRLIKTIEELNLFIVYETTLQSKTGHGLRRVIKHWYNNQETEKLYEAITTNRSLHGWTHKDMVRLAHVKTLDDSKKVLLAYVSRDIEQARKQSVDKTKDLLVKLESFNEWVHCKDEKRAIELAASSEPYVMQVPGKLNRSTALWTILIPKMSLSQLINELGRFHRLGMLRTGQPILNTIVEALGDTAKCRSSGLQPATVLIKMKQFERPRPIDPKLREHLAAVAKKKEDTDKEQPSSGATEKPAYSRSHVVTAALGRLLHHSLRNVRPLPTSNRPKLCMLTIEVRGGEGVEGLLKPCFGCPPVRYGEAAALLVLLMQRLISAQHVLLACFNGADVMPIQLESTNKDASKEGEKSTAEPEKPRDKKGKDGEKGKIGCVTLAQILNNLREAGGKCKNGAVLARPLRWAIDNRKPVDMFVNIIVTGDCASRVAKTERHKEDIGPLGDLVQKYRIRTKLPQTKVLNIALCGRSLLPLAETKPICPGILNIVGFDSHVPAVFTSFLAAPVL